MVQGAKRVEIRSLIFVAAANCGSNTKIRLDCREIANDQNAIGLSNVV
jgi:hypothetical protein